MGNFYRVAADKRDLNYDKYFAEGKQQKALLTTFNSNNAEILDVTQIKRNSYLCNIFVMKLKNGRE